MKYLLDTHILLWMIDQYEQLSPEALLILGNPENSIYFSAANIWEVAIKSSLGRKDFDLDPHDLRSSALWAGYIELAITGKHGAAVAMLPAIHNDPFDRLLIAQAITEDITLLTHDAAVAKYPGPILLV
ncbi:MAG: type II toxin-antitoxin system VapC family toxin [Cellulomonadaceae bacterium]|jgi:PIN domain nuclease of toxin-antitoxin system|nr:type II toxin-antitoxin system VapC family toxin [Cellulomonadaceae bacterium]